MSEPKTRPLTIEEARELAGRDAAQSSFEAAVLCQVRPPSKRERARLLSWMRERMAGYVEGCLNCMEPWVWSAELESDRDEMAGWIADDLGLDGRGDAVTEVIASRHGPEDPVQARALCEAAGWPS